MVADTDSQFRMHAVQSLLNLGQTIESNNRGLRDGYFLLRGELSDNMEPEWEFTQITDLDTDILIPEKIELKSWSKLIELIKKAKQQTPSDFDVFKRQFKEHQDSEAYLAWFYKYVPYLVAGLVPNKDNWLKARKRLDWFLSTAPNEGCPQELLEDHALLYITMWYQNKQVS